MTSEVSEQQPPPPYIPPPPPPPAPDRRISIEQLAALGPIAADDRRVAWVNALVDADIARQSYATDVALARQFAVCGQFDDIKGTTMEQAVATAMVKIQLGRAWGFNAADSIKNIYFVGGKPALEQDIVASKLQQAGVSWEPEFEYETVQPKGGRPWQKCVGCTLWVKVLDEGTRRYKPLMDRKGNPVSVSFTLADAENAKYYEKGQTKPLSEKFNYQSYPSDMYYWRCISRLRKYYAPHVLRGGVVREEALESMQIDNLPRELQPPLEEEAPPSKLRDRILAQENFSPADPSETQPPLTLEAETPKN